MWFRSRPRADALLAAVSLAVFALVAIAVQSGLLDPLDSRVSLAVHARSSPAGVAAMRWITRLGTPAAFLPLAVACSAWAWSRRRLDLAAGVVAAQGLALGSSWLLKLAFHRNRPALWERLAPSSFAFPSGHAICVTAAVGASAWAVGQLAPRLRRPALAAWVTAVLGVGASRIVLGVHWPSDVIGGVGLGLALLAACWTLADWLRIRPRSHLPGEAQREAGVVGLGQPDLEGPGGGPPHRRGQ